LPPIIHETQILHFMSCAQIIDQSMIFVESVHGFAHEGIGTPKTRAEVIIRPGQGAGGAARTTLGSPPPR
jgi:hypothetical protein